MDLTSQQKKACEELFKATTGKTIKFYEWNEKGANALYDMIKRLNHCSKGIAWMAKFPAFPATSKSTIMAGGKVGWYLFKMWQEYKKIEHETGKHWNPRCLDSGFRELKEEVLMSVYL